LRCSRPLCSSQATGGDPPKPAPTPTTRSGSTAGEPRKHPHSGAREGSNEKRPFPQDPTACQAAPLTTPASTPTPQGSRQYYQRREARRPTSRCSTHELHPERVRLERGPGRSHHR
jgi:hypothetical protein